MPRDDVTGTARNGAAVSPLVYGPLTHLWQAARWNPALDAGYFGLDERSAADTVRQTIELAHLLTYYAADGTPNDPQAGPGWPDFLRDDPSFLLARISAHREDTDLHPVAVMEQWYAEATRISVILPDNPVSDWVMAAIEAAVDAARRLSGTDAVTPFDPSAPRGIGRFAGAGGFGLPANPHTRAEASAALSRIADRARAALETELAQDDRHPPQTGLFLAFAQVLQTTRARLNGLTEKHLAFYYGQVLGMSPALARPDSAWLELTLAPGHAPFALPKGTVFLGPQQPDGIAPRYITDRAAAVTGARLVQTRALRLPLDRAGAVAGVLGFDAAALPGAAWPAFGPPDPSASDRAAAVAAGRSGLVFLSDALASSGVARKITLALSFARDAAGDSTLATALTRFKAQAKGGRDSPLPPDALPGLIAGAFAFSLSGAKGQTALPAGAVAVELAADHPDSLRFVLTLPPDFPAVAANAKAGDPALARQPALSMWLNPDAPVFGLAALGPLVVTAAHLSVGAQRVTGLRSGPPPGKPLSASAFAPFGPAPAPGLSLEISHPDLAQKRLTMLALDWAWQGLPAAPADLASHYAPYGLNTRNSDFRADFALWQSGDWRAVLPTGQPEAALDKGVPLFTAPGTDTMTRTAHWRFAPLDLPAQPATQPPRLRLTFAAPGYGLANTRYPDILGAAVLRNARQQQSLWAKLTGAKPAPLPPAPVQLRIAGLSLSYNAEASLAQGEITILAQQPFAAPVPAERPMLAPMPMIGQDMLFLGFRGLGPGAALDLLLDLEETAQAKGLPVTASPPARLHWAYLGGNGWRALPHDALVRDGTRALTTTGIATFRLPADLAVDAAGTAWLALTAPPGTQPLCQFRRIVPDAVQVTRKIDARTAPVGVPSIPAGAIKQPQVRIAALAAVAQPLASDGGTAAETTRAFHIRLSERLANRDRAITPRDYEALTLARFPDVAEAKCILRGDGRLDLIAAGVDGRSGAGAWPVLPMGRREQIAAYLRDKSADWSASIAVSNPVFEPVQLRGSVVIDGTMPPDAVLNGITGRFAELLCPWRLDPALPMALGCGRVLLADLEAELSTLPGVALLTGLSLVQFYPAGPAQGLRDTARGQAFALSHKVAEVAQSAAVRCASPRSVLVPAPRHALDVIAADRRIGAMRIGRDLYAGSPAEIATWQAGTPVPCAPQAFGIGEMRIGQTLIPTLAADAAPVPAPKRAGAGLRMPVAMAPQPPRAQPAPA